MTQRWGDTLARQIASAIKAPVATTAAITAIAADDRTNGMSVLETTNGSVWWFDDDSTAVAGPAVLVPDSGSGRWLAVGGASGTGVGTVNISTVRCRTTAALDASTRSGAVLTRTGNGALAAQDGVTLVVGDRLLVADEAGADRVDNGPHQVTSLGSPGTPWVLTRVGDADVSAEVHAGMLHYISEGTVYGNEWAYLTNDDTITLNATQLVYAQVPNLVDLASVANGLGGALIGIEDAATRFAGTTAEAVIADLGARVALAFANTAAQTAYAAAARADRQIAIVDDDDAGVAADGSLWLFDAASGAGASDYCRVPDVGTGRWLRLIPTLAELALTTAAKGASLVGITDATGLITGTTVETALVELAGDIDVLSPGVPMQNRLRMLGAPGAITPGDTVTIGADTYEFRGDTPPTGGNALNIWVYNGATSATARANIMTGINGGALGATIGNLIATELVRADAGVTVGDIVIQSSATIGGAAAPSATATACSEVLSTGTDIWDAAAMRFGRLPAAKRMVARQVTLGAPDVAKGDVQVYFDFAPAGCLVYNRNRAQDEAYAIVGNAISLTLAGGVSPNNQAADVLDFFAFA